MIANRVLAFVLVFVLSMMFLTGCEDILSVLTPDSMNGIDNEKVLNQPGENQEESNENNGNKNEEQAEKYSEKFLDKFGFNHSNTAFAKVKILEIYDLYFNIDRFVAKIEIVDDYFGGLQAGAVYHISIGIAGTVGDTSDPRQTYKAIDVISEYECLYLYFNYDEIVTTATMKYDYTRSEYFDGEDYDGPMREIMFDNYIVDIPAIKQLHVLPIKDDAVDISKLSEFSIKTDDEFTKIFLNNTDEQIKTSVQEVYTLTAPTAKKSLPDEFYNKYGYNAEGDMFVMANLVEFLPGIYDGDKIVASIFIYEDSYKALSHKLGNYYISINIGDYGTEAEKNERAARVKELLSAHANSLFICVPSATEALSDDLTAFPTADESVLGFIDADITLDSYRIIPIASASFYDALAEIFGSDFPKYDVYYEQTFIGVDESDIRLFIMNLYSRGLRTISAETQCN